MWRTLRCGIHQIWRQEGIRGLYRGQVPSLMKSLPAISIGTVQYDPFPFPTSAFDSACPSLSWQIVLFVSRACLGNCARSSTIFYLGIEILKKERFPIYLGIYEIPNKESGGWLFWLFCILFPLLCSGTCRLRDVRAHS